MVVVDQQVRFDAFVDYKGALEKIPLWVTGTVYAVNYKHKVFHIVYYIGDIAQRTSFKFCDIGEKVWVV